MVRFVCPASCKVEKDIRVKSVCLAALSVAFLAACTASSYQGEPTNERRVQYACTNGENIEMRFFPLQGVGVLVRHGQPMELQQQPAASGFIYTNGPNTVRGKGNDLTIEIGRMVPIQCQAR